MSNAEQAEALQTGAIDIGLMHTPVAVGGRMRERQLLRERLVAAVPDEFQIGEDGQVSRSEEHTSELQSPCNLVCRLLLEKKKKRHRISMHRLVPCLLA